MGTFEESQPHSPPSSGGGMAVDGKCNLGDTTTVRQDDCWAEEEGGKRQVSKLQKLFVMRAGSFCGAEGPLIF